MSVNREVHDYIAPEVNFEQQSLNVENIAANLGNISVQNVVEAPFSASPELSRKQIIDKNIKVLRKRFGDEFVKGERIDSGGYADGGARELLATFLEYPDAAERIKRLIPNKHQALTTLQDNSEYIIHQLSQDYQNENLLEQEQPQDPYELAKNAGYELTGPFEDVASFEQYKADFRSKELLCTYSDPESRLNTYHISWLRRPNAAEIMPADELTEDNLCENWKSYLRANKRYSAETDSYNLTGLQPAREDPYGTSSMSVQVSRLGNHVSIKNRYNHTVSNPDNTYNSNLDNISYGLKLGLYHQLEREDLIEVNDHHLDGGYVLDNNGGIHKYYQEIDNRYLGYYEYIENGVVTTIDKGAYDMISPEIYVGKNQQAEVMGVSGEYLQAKVEALEDGTRNLHVYNRYGDVQQTYSYSGDQQAEIKSVRLTVAEGVWVGNIENNPALVELNVLEGAKVRYIDKNPSLTEISIGKKAKVERIHCNNSLEKLNINAEAMVDRIQFNSGLSELYLAESAEVKQVFENQALVKLSTSEGAKVEYVFENPSLTELNIGKKAKFGYINDNRLLTELNIGKKTSIKEIAYNQTLNKLIIPEGAKVERVTYNPELTELTLSNQATVESVIDNNSLDRLNISQDAKVDFISQNSSLAEINVSERATITYITYNPLLEKINIGKEASIGRIACSDILTELHVGEKAKVSSVESNSALTNLTIGEGADVRYIVNNRALVSLTLANGANVQYVHNNHPSMPVMEQNHFA